METKTGRPRRLVFDNTKSGIDPGDRWMLGMLVELGERTYDQIEHLPAAALDSTKDGSYLVPSNVVLHLVGSDLKIFGFMLGKPLEPDYSAEVEKTTSGDFESMRPSGRRCVELLAEHLEYRNREILPQFSEAGFLDRSLDHPNFAQIRDVLGHLLWHWSFHSGHIGAVTLGNGYEYVWTSSSKGS